MADGLTIWPLVLFFFIMADGLPLADDPTYLTLADGLSWPTALLSGRLPYSNSGRRPYSPADGLILLYSGQRPCSTRYYYTHLTLADCLIIRPTALVYFVLADGLILLYSGRRPYYPACRLYFTLFWQTALFWPTAVFWMAALFHIILVDDLLSDNYYYQAKGLGR